MLFLQDTSVYPARYTLVQEKVEYYYMEDLIF